MWNSCGGGEKTKVLKIKFFEKCELFCYYYFTLTFINISGII